MTLHQVWTYLKYIGHRELNELSCSSRGIVLEDKLMFMIATSLLFPIAQPYLA